MNYRVFSISSGCRQMVLPALATLVLMVFAVDLGAATAAPTTAPAPIEYTSASDAGTATVSGTSTLHDWTVKSTTIKGTVQISGPWNAAPPAFESIQLSIPVNSLKSTEGGGMDDKTHEALKREGQSFDHVCSLQRQPEIGGKQR